ncbi:hypothetical protein AAE478_004347 [Parahypoxylon ruwenzoriense]
MAQDQSAQLPVLIIGSGIPYKIFESDASLAPRKRRDWGVACHWSCPMLASLIGDAKWSRIRETLVDPHMPVEDVIKIRLLHGKTGEVFDEKPVPGLHRVLRSRLRYLITEDVIDVQFGKTLERISYADDGTSVTAHFADGTAETGRLIVGADGSQSRVRWLLLGAERTKLKRLPIAAIFINASFSRDRALWLRKHYTILNPVVHPDNQMGLLALLDGENKDDPESWRFAFYISWLCSVEEQTSEVASGMGVRERLRQIKEKSKTFGEPLRSCYEWIPDDLDEVYWIGSANWDPSLPEHEWDNHGGRVTLLGDAAHPMTFHRGQGLNHAIADAFKLVELLANLETQSREQLIGAYETEMRARGGEEVRLSELNSFMMHDWENIAQSPLLKRGLAYGSGDDGKA